MTNKYTRSSNYRQMYFNKHHGFLHTGIYHCSYCGKLLTKKNVSVDHLIPIHRVKHFGVARILMWICGIKNINSPKNLISSCKHCNSKKGSKMGKWLIRGFFGKFWITWIVIWIIVLALLLLIVTGHSDIIINALNSFLKTNLPNLIN